MRPEKLKYGGMILHNEVVLMSTLYGMGISYTANSRG